ncbi:MULTISPECIES: hypothetical protein [Rhizobium/Agrobacterium group]|uniref:hypothetical protein n=1 Tax=Rhizobium/Agrobacterium group TaxID=227290 RepID=UPI00023A18FB|nr:hypothetical protein [Rhizobium sp. AN88]AHK04043.1 hypothetical protein X971_4199 [Agrobacterium tumefaciens LBA4213 (Ach5)]AKC09786.1 hypothetical protein Ach5_40130 [Agrobacterium tumefaciens]AYM18930.1 hypothetical protein At15955_39450 [Agrobacterium tumefaciens]EHJ95827.1 hypothetical protein AT5A_24115 [Agrobacterium tumefaciens 5A]MDP9562167.1 hypothetical protein [Rhizobium nepotum]CUX03504.1 conserved hypothetical protein [Agrobacterium fabacearum TT111]
MARTLDIASRDATSGTVKSMREAAGPIDILVKIPMPPASSSAETARIIFSFESGSRKRAARRKAKPE